MDGGRTNCTRDHHIMRHIDFVIPAYNEVDNLVDLSTGIINECESRGVKSFKIIIVENGSDDGSADLIRSLNEKDSRVVGLVLSRNFGPQGAIHAGISHSEAEYCCVMDGDQQDPPFDALEMLTKAKINSADVVYAVRASREEGFIRKIGFKIFYRVWRFSSDVNVPLDAGEFAVMSRAVVLAILSSPEVHRFNRGLRSWAGFKQMPYPHHRPNRIAGEQKFNVFKDTMLGIQAVLSFSLVPLRIIFISGLLLASFSFLIMILNFLAILLRSLGIEILYDSLPLGITSLNLINLFFQSAVFIALGVLGEYVGRIYEQTKGRPTYLVSKLIGSLDE